MLSLRIPRPFHATHTVNCRALASLGAFEMSPGETRLLSLRVSRPFHATILHTSCTEQPQSLVLVLLRLLLLFRERNGAPAVMSFLRVQHFVTMFMYFQQHSYQDTAYESSLELAQRFLGKHEVEIS